MLEFVFLPAKLHADIPLFDQGATTLLKIIILSPFIRSSKINQGYQGCTLDDKTNMSETESTADS